MPPASEDRRTEVADPPPRLERRKAKTRAALIASAQHFLALPGGQDTSIQEITDRADVGFGSFYNHFESKAELFAVALEELLDNYARFLAATVEGITDPARIVVANARLTGRLASMSSQVAGTLLNAGPRYLFSDRGLIPQVRAQIAAGTEAGRFTVPDVDLAVAALAGSLVAVVQLVQIRPSEETEQLIDGMAEHHVRFLGISPEEARELVAEPLPDGPVHF